MQGPQAYRMILFLIFIFATAKGFGESSLRDFETDGCTYFAEGTTSQPQLWAHCCYEHDLRYWFGDSVAHRNEADLYLKSCVNDSAGPAWAQIIYDGVKAGQSSPIKSKYHWGWGWTPKRGSTNLTKAEISYVKDRLAQMNLDPAFLQLFTERYLEEQ